MENKKRLTDVNPIIRNLTAMKSMYDAIALDGMIKALEEAPAVDAAEVLRDQWISVEDRLPEAAEIYNKNSEDEFSLSNPVLTFGKNGFAIAMVERDENHNIFVDFFGEIIKEVTNWMPLPDPPEEDKL